MWLQRITTPGGYGRAWEIPRIASGAATDTCEIRAEWKVSDFVLGTNGPYRSLRIMGFYLGPGIHASCYLCNESADAALISEQGLVITRNISWESTQLRSIHSN